MYLMFSMLEWRLQFYSGTNHDSDMNEMRPTNTDSVNDRRSPEAGECTEVLSTVCIVFLVVVVLEFFINLIQVSMF